MLFVLLLALQSSIGNTSDLMDQFERKKQSVEETRAAERRTVAVHEILGVLLSSLAKRQNSPIALKPDGQPNLELLPESNARLDSSAPPPRWRVNFYAKLENGTVCRVLSEVNAAASDNQHPYAETECSPKEFLPLTSSATLAEDFQIGSAKQARRAEDENQIALAKDMRIVFDQTARYLEERANSRIAHLTGGALDTQLIDFKYWGSVAFYARMENQNACRISSERQMGDGQGGHGPPYIEWQCYPIRTAPAATTPLAEIFRQAEADEHRLEAAKDEEAEKLRARGDIARQEKYVSLIGPWLARLHQSEVAINPQTAQGQIDVISSPHDNGFQMAIKLANGKNCRVVVPSGTFVPSTVEDLPLVSEECY